MNILFSDEHLAVAVKPYGVLSENDEKKPNMPSMLRRELCCDYISAVHRLDRTTQGLMVYAKSQEAAKRLSAMAQAGEIEKIYLAVVEGVPKESEAELADLLYYDRKANKSYVVKRARKGVKEARLSYETLSGTVYEGQELSLLRIRLFTGRTHQIRVQLSSRGLPLAGDRRYGGRLKIAEIMLCSSRLDFTHPLTGEALSFEYLPDNDLFALFCS